MAAPDGSVDEKDVDEDNYLDAFEDLQIQKNVELAKGVEDCGITLKLFLNNKFSEARERLIPYVDHSFYHSLANSSILYIQAVMTFDMGDIETAINSVKKSLIVCGRQRKRTSLLGSITRVTSKVSYDEHTEDEIHAELCYAECLLFRALLTFIQDENLISFVKGGLKIRECYRIYKECNKILQKRNFTNEKQKLHFESGVRMGVGAFNLMISLLPGKVLKLLEFVGFSGNKQVGLTELKKGCDLQNSLRGPLCSIILISYHTVVSFVLGLGDGDIDFADEVLKPCLVLYPKGALFLFFAGRVQEVRGNIEEAVVKFEESIDCQQEWRQFHHLCFWELMWCHSFRGDWLMAMKYAERLCKESRWSRATYMYQKASFLMMCDDHTEQTQAHLEYLFGEVPKLKQRIAGKSLPIEKFAVFKAKRYTDQGNKLTLPALELIYLWNGFAIIGKKMSLLEPLLSIIESTINELVENKDSHMYYQDDYALTLLLKGVCLKYRDQTFQAEQCFHEIIANEKQIKQDTFLPPYAMMELALLHLKQHKLADVKKLLEKAKRHYKGYLLESRLHFRLHAAKLLLQTMQADSIDLSSPPTSPKDTDSIASSFSVEDAEEAVLSGGSSGGAKC